MQKYYFFIFLFTLPLSFSLYAEEWSKKDSIWLKQLLLGGDSIPLNPEFQRRIESGSLLQDGSPASEMRLSQPELFPLVRSFDFLPDWRERSLHELPSSVFMLYNFKGEPEGLMIPPPVFKIPEGISDGSTAILRFDLNDVLSSLLIPQYRAIKRNQKKAVAYKLFIQPVSFPSTSTEEERRTLNDFVNQLRERE